jgi:hypothetical protein
MTDTKMTRRAALASLSTVAAIGAPSAVAAMGEPETKPAPLSYADAALLELNKELDACIAEFARHKAMPEFPHPAWDALSAAHPEEKHIVDYDMSCINARANAAFDAIMCKRPFTIEGLHVMARAARLEIEWWCASAAGDLDPERRTQFDLSEAVINFVNWQKGDMPTYDESGRYTGFKCWYARPL